jgi:uncharacterized protein GlcG (DUF336 family)
MSDNGHHPVKSSLTLAAADNIIDGALATARAENMMPLAVAVLDSGGHLVAYKREDGASILRFEIATGKAYGALGMGQSSRAVGDRLKERLAFQGAIAAASDGRFVPVPGGALILNNSQEAIGAVGISGDNSDADERAALAGIRAAGLVPAPSEPTSD